MGNTSNDAITGSCCHRKLWRVSSDLLKIFVTESTFKDKQVRTICHEKSVKNEEQY